MLQTLTSFFGLSTTTSEQQQHVLKSSTSLAFNQCLKSDLQIRIFPVTQVENQPQDFRLSRHVAAFVADKLWIFGGSYSYPIIKSNDLRTLDPVKKKWERVNTTGTPPSPRSDHSIAVVDKFIYVFGGSDEKVTPLNDVHVLDTETLTWTAIETKGLSPSPRSGHTTVAIGSKVFYFGGAKWNPSSSQWVSKSNELYVFDTVTCSWSKPSTTGKISFGFHFCGFLCIWKTHLVDWRRENGW